MKTIEILQQELLDLNRKKVEQLILNAMCKCENNINISKDDIMPEILEEAKLNFSVADAKEINDNFSNRLIISW